MGLKWVVLLGLCCSAVGWQAWQQPGQAQPFAGFWNMLPVNWQQMRAAQQQQQMMAQQQQQWLAPHVAARRFYDQQGGVQFLVQGQSSSGLPEPQFNTAPQSGKPYVLGHRVVKSFPHDANAFTQGLFMHNNTLFESTGLYGQSSVRKVDLSTGRVTQMSKFASNIFGEGITMHSDGKIYGLSWKERLAFRIDPDTLQVEKEFAMPAKMKEGWGITSDGKNLLVTDSTQTLFYLDTNFAVLQTYTMHDPHQNSDLPYVNELEFVNGKLYGNVYGLDHVVVMDAKGQVEQWVDCRGLWTGGRRGGNAVMNGIAYDKAQNKLYVTGKNWSNLYEIELTQS